MLKALLYFMAGSMPPASAPRELEGAGGEICSLCGGLGLEIFSAERRKIWMSVDSAFPSFVPPPFPLPRPACQECLTFVECRSQGRRRGEI